MTTFRAQEVAKVINNDKDSNRDIVVMVMRLNGDGEFYHINDIAIGPDNSPVILCCSYEDMDVISDYSPPVNYIPEPNESDEPESDKDGDIEEPKVLDSIGFL